MKRELVPALVLTALVAAPSAARAGWTATQTNKSVGGVPTSQSAKLTWEKNKLRIDPHDGTTMTLDLDTAKVTLAHDAKKLFVTMSLDDVMKKRNEQIQEMKKRIPQLAPADQERVKAQLDRVEKQTTLPVLKPTGKKDKVNGYDCELFTWTDADGNAEACIAPKVPADIAPFMASVGKLSDRLVAMGNAGLGSFSVFAKHGFPVRVKHVLKDGDRTHEVISEMSDIKTVKVDESFFKTPQGYEETDLASLMGNNAPKGTTPAKTETPKVEKPNTKTPKAGK